MFKALFTRGFRFLLGVGVACMLWLAAPQTVSAQEVVCNSFTMQNIAFGNFTPFDPAPTTGGSLSFQCYNTNAALFGLGPSIYAAVCFNLGTGSAGGSAATRNMTTSGIPAPDVLQYQIYKGGSVIWGSGAAPGSQAAQVVLELPVKWILGGYVYVQGSVTFTAAVAPGQTTAVPGNYRSDFNGSSAQIVVATSSSSNVSCIGSTSSSTNASLAQSSLSFSATAKVLPTCSVRVSADSTLDFGAINPITSGPFDARSSINARCTNKTNYNVALEPSGSPTPTNGTGTLKSATTVLTNPDTYVNYGLFRDAARTQPWGNIPGSNTVDAQGTGDFLTTPMTVYGRITNGNVRPGNYTDTVSVKITY